VSSAPAARLAVLGKPIAHSQSPALHRAAYVALGLDWQYEAVEMDGDSLAQFIRSRDDSWRGLSLTMPLKRDVLPLLDSGSDLVQQSGSANTVLFEGGSVLGFNTDVYGITEAFHRHGRAELSTVLILGGGATAASAIVASARMSATRVFLAVRSPERLAGLVDIGRAQGVEVLVRRIDAVDQIDERLDAVISTLPNGTNISLSLDPDTTRTATLFDVAYHPWPSTLAAGWTGENVISGLEMLVLQALAQVRIFVGGDETAVLPAEDRVLAAMLSAVGL
jgi:shikimate dehydrogenase